jgi:hypothetical protein
MAVVKVVNSKASIGYAINYITKKEKTEEKLISGIECNPNTAINEMKATKKIWNKEGGRQYKHFVHSFAAGEKVTTEQAHQLAMELCKDRFKGFEVLIATHEDKKHIHSHIIVNSVSHENGYKFQQSKEDLAEMKSHCNEISKENGLSVPQKGKTFDGKNRTAATSFDKEKYQFLLKAEKGEVKSYVLDTAIAVIQSKEQAKSREDFIAKMVEKGYETEWKDNHKNITFTDKEGNKVRNSNIEKTFNIKLSKEQLENEFINKEQQAGMNPERKALDELIKDAKQKQKSLEGKESRAADQRSQHRESELSQERSSEDLAKENLHWSREYISLDLEISMKNKLTAKIKNEVRLIDNDSDEIIKREAQIQSFNRDIENLQEKKQGLNSFHGKEKKSIDEQINHLDYCKQQVSDNLERSQGIKPEQAQEKLAELRVQRAEILKELPSMGDIDRLKSQQEMAAVKYSISEIELESRPDREQFTELVKKIKATRQYSSRELQAERKLNQVGKPELEKMLKSVPENSQAAELIKNKMTAIIMDKIKNHYRGPTR